MTEPGPQIAADQADQPVFDAFQFTSFQQMLDALGIERDYAAWARARGQPYTGGGLFTGDAAGGYEELSDEALRSLAAQGDTMALTVLSDRTFLARPVETLDWWRQQADAGSAYAIGQTATQLRYLASTLDQTRIWDEQQQARIRSLGTEAGALRAEAMAWTLLDEVYLGRPRGALVNPYFGSGDGSLPVELGNACARAAELAGQLEMAWSSRGVTGPPTGPPPIGHDSPVPRPGYLEACPEDLLPTPDLSNCRTFSMTFQDAEFPVDWQMYACPGDAGG